MRSGKIILHLPPRINRKIVRKLIEDLKREAWNLGLNFEGPYYNERRIIIYYEDQKIKTFIFVSDENPDNIDIDSIKYTIRVLALIAMHEEEEICIRELLKI